MTRAIGRIGALLRLGMAETMAYRAAIVVWILTTTFPLVSLALWHAIAADGPVGGWDQEELGGYFVAAFVVRQATACWVSWELERLIRNGELTPLLLRPVHPILHEAMANLASLPLRLALALPLSIAVLMAVGDLPPLDRASSWFLAPIAVAGGWLINFSAQVAVGCLAFWWTRASALYELWLGLYVVLSGYAVPVGLFPPGVADAVRWLPFYATLGFPSELWIGRLSTQEIVIGFATQLGWIVLLATLAATAWRRGLRHYGAEGA